MEKVFKVADIRDLEQKVALGEMSYSRMVEVLNEKAEKHYSKVKKLNEPAVINCAAIPEWLTEDMRAMAKQTWNEHRVVNDNKRVEAMRIVQRGASAAGYTIDIKKAVELLKQHCL